MAATLQRISSYFEHLIKARTRHSVHSPFVYGLVEHVLRPQTERPEFAAIEELRAELLNSEQTIRVNDLGAGSRVLDLPVRRVADITRASLKGPKEAQLLFRLARYMDAAHVLELGTCFGLTTLYLAQGAENGEVHTIEGCPHIHRIALHHFEQMRQPNIQAHLGSFNRQLPLVLARIPALGLVFIDGHHAKAPTLSYFEQCLEKATNDTVFVLDDIHWSREMEEAWETIKGHPRVTVTIDLYGMGLVFLRTEQAKEHFRLRC